eukprot:1156545-Pelagomonas_calceolata.AAC.4
MHVGVTLAASNARCWAHDPDLFAVSAGCVKGVDVWVQAQQVPWTRGRFFAWLPPQCPQGSQLCIAKAHIIRWPLCAELPPQCPLGIQLCFAKAPMIQWPLPCLAFTLMPTGESVVHCKGSYDPVATFLPGFHSNAHWENQLCIAEAAQMSCSSMQFNAVFDCLCHGPLDISYQLSAACLTVSLCLMLVP